MKKHSLLLFFLTATLYGAAQTHKPAPPAFHRWSLDLLAGPAFPVGQFTNLPSKAPSAGPIHAGGIAELSATYHLNRTWGLTLLTAGQLNKGNGILWPGEPTNGPATIPNK